MNLYRVQVSRVQACDESARENLEPGKTVRCAVVAGQGVSRELAEQFARAAYKRGITVDVFMHDEAPELLFSSASQKALQIAKASRDMQALPILTDDVSKFYLLVANLKLEGENLVVFEYTPGEDWTDSFSW